MSGGALARADVLAPQTAPDRAALGVTVVVRDEDGNERAHRLVTAEEYALLGARVNDVRELRAPKGVSELEVLRLEGEPAPTPPRGRPA